MRNKDKYREITVTSIRGKLIVFTCDSFNNKVEVIGWAKWSLKNDHYRSGLYFVSASGEDARFERRIRFSNKQIKK